MENSKNLRLKIVVNDEPIPMNPFVQDIIKNIILSMVTSLKLKNEPEKIEITLNKE